MKEIKAYLFANTANYQGHVDERFMDLATQFSRMQDARTNLGGAALVVYFQGRKVVDIWTGKKSETESWQTDTLSLCYSTGKGVLSTLAHILVSEGFLDYDIPVARYWPEFAQQGKDKISLRHILSHQSGLYDIRHLVADASEMADWPHMLDVLAQAKPRFEVATDAAYQPLTFGWQVGGVLENATGKTLAELMQHYLIDSLQLDAAYFGVPKEKLANVARIMPQQKFSTDKPQNAKAKVKPQQARKASPLDKLLELSGQNPQDFQDAMIPKGMKNFSFFSDAGLQAIIPAATGVFSANSLARIYAMLANAGEWQGQQLIQPEVFQQLSQIQYTRRDRIMPLPMHWRLGYHRVLTLGKSSSGFGHMGFNGSGAWCDPERGLSFAYTHNFPVASITGDYRLWGLTQEALRCTDRILYGRKGWF
ncbi:class A beta-lactamase-related serine hydrolase [Acinetobacter sp. ANC 4216]|uniref:serine hydrolase domain-containing protein n=1 Tax=Acinetobacter sp. ANC 4216 TaxID=2529840 RepID=UPI00103C82B3|nr:serine hydrolase domain-containing protein [Acinetobacter sp. ANC 4216]TCB66196.1 class A beta-lactamase-related serine hydrolase [Acinetobacter sp. ANC 4216]